MGTDRAVAEHLTAEGYPVDPTTITKWRRKLNVECGAISYRGQARREERRAQEANEERARGVSDLAQEVKRYLARCRAEKSIEELCDHFGVCPKDLRGAIDNLEDAAVLVKVTDDVVSLDKGIPLHETPRAIDVRKYAEVEHCFGVTADNHLGSKYERLDVLEALFDRYQDAGVKTVYQGGNIIDGEAPFNKFDIYARGVGEQVENLVEKWPHRKGITTEFVTGDDHEGWYVQREHLNVGQLIEDTAYKAGRDDLRHLGYMERDIVFEQAGGSAKVRVIHAGGGSTYATSYTSQKYVETLQEGEKPQIVLVGHFHKFDYCQPRGVHVIQMGCTQDQTPFMRKRRIRAEVGGGIVWVRQNELGIFTSVKVEWIPFFGKKFYEYRW